MSRRCCAFALMVACVLVVVGCGKQQPVPTQNAGTAQPTQSTQSAPAEPTGGPAKVGDDLKAGSWTFTVSQVTSKMEAPGQVKPAAGKEFMYVNVRLGNDGASTLEIEAEDFSMKDSSGSVLKPFGKRQAYNAYMMTPLQPKYGTSTAFIYEVTPGSTGYLFTFSPEVDGKRVPLEVTVP